MFKGSAVSTRRVRLPRSSPISSQHYLYTPRAALLAVTFCIRTAVRLGEMYHWLLQLETGVAEGSAFVRCLRYVVIAIHKHQLDDIRAVCGELVGGEGKSNRGRIQDADASRINRSLCPIAVSSSRYSCCFLLGHLERVRFITGLDKRWHLGEAVAFNLFPTLARVISSTARRHLARYTRGGLSTPKGWCKPAAPLQALRPHVRRCVGVISVSGII